MNINQKFLFIIVCASPIFLSACSSSLQRGEPLIAADEMMDGPGIFSGKAGGFYLVGGNTDTVEAKPVNKMTLEETSLAIDNKIKQLNQDRIELERLKRQLKKRKVY